jgi:hypothetical protein
MTFLGRACMAAGVSLVLTLLLMLLYQDDSLQIEQGSPTQVTQKADDSVFGPR